MTEQTRLCAIEDTLTPRQKIIVRRINTFPRLSITRLVVHIAKEDKVDLDPELIRGYRAARKRDRLTALIWLRNRLPK